MSVKILIGDALAQLRTLPDKSVQCCVSSPPYYGLRDYGTATWEGGDPGCDHKGPPLASERTGLNHGKGRGPYEEAATIPYRQKCGKCGAVRKDGQIGLEPTPEAHIAALVEVFGEVRRVLRKDGAAFVNYGDCYATQPAGNKGITTTERWSPPKADNLTYGGNKPYSTIGNGYKAKDLLMMPARVALALQADGWWIRSMMPWVKRSAMPESVTDRPATAIEYVFMLTKSARYFWDGEAVRQAHKPESQDRYKYGYGLPRQFDKSVTPQDGGKTPNFQFAEGGRNFRNSDLFYASLEPPHGLISGPDGEPLALDVNPAGYSESHFATFPPKLIEPLIKAATSEKGCCADCGAPWVREVETENIATRGSSTIGPGYKIGVYGHDRSGHKPGVQKSKTLGWFPSCECKEGLDRESFNGGEPVPCTVLDPFGGAGTTGLVADRLGRNAILIELNPEYAEMARGRISGDSPLFAEVVS